MILRDATGEPIVFTVRVGKEWDHTQLVQGHLDVLGSLKSIYRGEAYGYSYDAEPLGVSFVPLDDQTVDEELR